MMPWGGMMGWGGGFGMGLGFLFNLIILLAIVVGVVYAARWLRDDTRRRPGSSGSDEAVDILRARYARGEIDRDEFETKKRDLQTR